MGSIPDGNPFPSASSRSSAFQRFWSFKFGQFWQSLLIGAHPRSSAFIRGKKVFFLRASAVKNSPPIYFFSPLQGQRYR
jgi:hypothetical protein